MFGQNTNPLNAYAAASIDAKVNSASPHELIHLLFEGAENAVSVAKLHMEQGNIEQKGQLISKAIDIINNGLIASLNMEVGGQLAQQLASLYEYMARRLITANIENSPAILTEVSELLAEIHSAWIEIKPKNQ